jgi:hypothetical protein
MADEEVKPGGILPPTIPEVRVISEIPVIFADGVMSHSFISGVSKFYLYRTDASPNVSEGSKNIPVAQIVMPAQGFAGMVHFFEHRLQLMVGEGAITQATVDKIKETIYADPRKTT